MDTVEDSYVGRLGRLLESERDLVYFVGRAPLSLLFPMSSSATDVEYSGFATVRRCLGNYEYGYGQAT